MQDIVSIRIFEYADFDVDHLSGDLGISLALCS